MSASAGSDLGQRAAATLRQAEATLREEAGKTLRPGAGYRNASGRSTTHCASEQTIRPLSAHAKGEQLGQVKAQLPEFLDTASDVVTGF
jgi:hypothetical protein